jgi:hypothetical protein
VPWMLLPKPLILKKRHEKRTQQVRVRSCVHRAVFSCWWAPLHVPGPQLSAPNITHPATSCLTPTSPFLLPRPPPPAPSPPPTACSPPRTTPSASSATRVCVWVGVWVGGGGKYWGPRVCSGVTLDVCAGGFWGD